MFKIGDLVQIKRQGGSTNLERYLGPPPYIIKQVAKTASVYHYCIAKFNQKNKEPFQNFFCIEDLLETYRPNHFKCGDWVKPFPGIGDPWNKDAYLVKQVVNGGSRISIDTEDGLTLVDSRLFQITIAPKEKLRNKLNVILSTKEKTCVGLDGRPKRKIRKCIK